MNSSRKGAVRRGKGEGSEGFNEAAMNSSRKGHLCNRHVFKDFRFGLREATLK